MKKKKVIIYQANRILELEVKLAQEIASSAKNDADNVDLLSEADKEVEKISRYAKELKDMCSHFAAVSYNISTLDTTIKPVRKTLTEVVKIWHNWKKAQ